MTTSRLPRTNGGDKAASGRVGWLRPYKPQQGFWTRLGTGIGAGLLILFTIQFLYTRLPTWVRTTATQVISAESADAIAAQAAADPTLRVVDRQVTADGVRLVTERTPLSPGGLWLYVVLAIVTALLCLLAWYLINRQRNAEFLINTDTEMKKVNWTTRRELVGSTKVVVFFMFFMAFVLFSYDLVFGTIFWFIDVLKIPPFFIQGPPAVPAALLGLM